MTKLHPLAFRQLRMPRAACFGAECHGRPPVRFVMQDSDYEAFLNGGGQLLEGGTALSAADFTGDASGGDLETAAAAVLGSEGAEWASKSGFADAASGGETHAAAGTV